MKPQHSATRTHRTITRRAAFGLAASSGLSLALAACGSRQASPDAGASSTSPTDNASVSESTNDRPSFMQQVTLQPEEQVNASAPAYTIEPDLSNVLVPESYYFDDGARQMIAQHGFFVDANMWDSEFYPVYEENRYTRRANFVTVDSLMHTYHLSFQFLLKGLERGVLSTSLAELSALMLDASTAQRGACAGSVWETAAKRNVLFFAVATALLDPSVSIPGSIAADVTEEVARVEAANGIQASLVTGENLDYTQFTVRGYYVGDETLERYFRAMMWYGLQSFYRREEDLDRSAALISLALEDDRLELWEQIYAVTSFFAGVSDDLGYYEYRPALETAFGSSPTIDALISDEDAWKAFRDLTAQMPAPRINSLPEGNAQNLSENMCFRFMGQRFSADAEIFQQLIYANVSPDKSGGTRLLPDALDIPAAFGSDEALDILSEQGATAYDGYTSQMEKMRAQCASLTDSFWQASLYNQWLLALQPLLVPKGDGYPFFMQNSLWTRRQLESFLGSYTELKHDTVLYSKQALAEGDGPIPEGDDDRGFVEPEPLLFRRLANLCAATSQGLEHFGMLGKEEKNDLGILESLSSQLSTIAAKELAGELPTDDEFELIRSIGVQLEHFWQQAWTEEAERMGVYLDTRQFPASVVVDVATGSGSCLELAVGRVSTLYAIVSVDGSLRVASGPVFTFHQFEQPTSNRLTDEEWRTMLQNSSQQPSAATDPRPWTMDYRYSRY